MNPYYVLPLSDWARFNIFLSNQSLHSHISVANSIDSSSRFHEMIGSIALEIPHCASHVIIHFCRTASIRKWHVVTDPVFSAHSLRNKLQQQLGIPQLEEQVWFLKRKSDVSTSWFYIISVIIKRIRCVPLIVSLALLKFSLTFASWRIGASRLDLSKRAASLVDSRKIFGCIQWFLSLLTSWKRLNSIKLKRLRDFLFHL